MFGFDGRVSCVRTVHARARQVTRFARLGVNLLSGSAFIGACYKFPKLSDIDNCYLNDYSIFNYWVSDLSRSMNVELHVSGQIMREPGLFVSNHISWLDTIVMNNIKPLSFVARHDLAEWPLLGAFTQRMASIFVDRSSKFHAYRSIPLIEQKLNEGRSVHLFPESTTSNGGQVLPFFPMFYEAAVRVGCAVQPVSIKYCDAAGNHIVEPAFIDNDSFTDTLERILRVDKVHAHVHFLTPLQATEFGRKELCLRSYQQIKSDLFY